MNFETRVQEIEDSIKSCSRERYHKEEIISEMLNFQQEIVNLTFEEEQESTRNLRMIDVLDYLSEVNEANGNIAQEELTQFGIGVKNFQNHFKKQYCKIGGLQKAFYAIDNMRENHVLIKNVELDIERGKIDGIVINEKGVCIVEVKNTHKDVFIDENGDYYKVEEEQIWDADLNRELKSRKKFIKSLLEKNGISDVDVYSIVVFTNKYIDVRNQSRDIETCFLRYLNYHIAMHSGYVCLNAEEISTVAEIIQNAVPRSTYKIGFNADLLKQKFAKLKAKLEMAEEIKQTEQERCEDSKVA